MTNVLLTILGILIGGFIINWLEKNVFNKERYTRRKK